MVLLSTINIMLIEGLKGGRLRGKSIGAGMPIGVIIAALLYLIISKISRL
jgi:hypothetical protein